MPARELLRRGRVQPAGERPHARPGQHATGDRHEQPHRRPAEAAHGEQRDGGRQQHQAGGRHQRGRVGAGQDAADRGQRRLALGRDLRPRLAARRQRERAGQDGADDGGGEFAPGVHPAHWFATAGRSAPRSLALAAMLTPLSAHRSSRSPSAVAIADSTARALCRVSASSVAGSLSATIPAPACT